MISFTVLGSPAPQGSKRHVGKGIMVESSLRVKPWREAVKSAAYEANTEQTMEWGPLSVTLHFHLLRPKSHYGTGVNERIVKASSPRFPYTRPDLDKLTRSTLDALTESGLIHDDAQIVQITAWKDYTDELQPTPGVFVTVDHA